MPLLTIIIVAVTLGLSTASKAEEDIYSANFMLEACKENPKESVFLRGVCAGQLQSIVLLASVGMLESGNAKICPPPQVTLGQAKKVVIKYIEQQPEDMHQPFLLLAIVALSKAWPCGMPQSK
jgi:hypothetical protein